MTPTDRLRIKVTIAGMTFFLRIDPKEEEAIRKAVKHIDDKLNVYREHFPGQTTEKYLAMIALHIGVLYQQERMRTDTLPFQEKFEELSIKLDEFLAESEKHV
ncbi:MAG: cell division protein ZapA [Bacteroidaceae bacterium]|nr:cell division protein ZapA [Bacteroidaceae bacterium]